MLGCHTLTKSVAGKPGGQASWCPPVPGLACQSCVMICRTNGLVWMEVCMPLSSQTDKLLRSSRGTFMGGTAPLPHRAAGHAPCLPVALLCHAVCLQIDGHTACRLACSSWLQSCSKGMQCFVRSHVCVVGSGIKAPFVGPGKRPLQMEQCMSGATKTGCRKAWASAYMPTAASTRGRYAEHTLAFDTCTYANASRISP